MRPRDGVPDASLDREALDLADDDDLTGLWNRRRFEQEFDRLIAGSRRAVSASRFFRSTWTDTAM